jgi:hypothetical protein
MRLVSFVLLFSTFAFGQSIAIGVKGGVPFNDAFDTSGIWSGESKSWTVGPTVELRLPFGLGAEFDALYRKVGFRSQTGFGQSLDTASQWQFPLLGKFRFPSILLHPYVDGGVVFNKLSFPYKFGPTAGGVVGFGGELKFGKLRIGPEIRYTRWGSGPTYAASQGQADFNQNQVDLLVGITWGK